MCQKRKIGFIIRCKIINPYFLQCTAPSLFSKDLNTESTLRISSKCATDTKSQIRTLNKAREQIEIYLECCVRPLETKSG